MRAPVATATVALGSAPTGARVTAVGWGLTTPAARRTVARLRAADLVVRSDDTCLRLYDHQFLRSVFLCANAPGGAVSAATTCEGDSGGPLVSAGPSGPVVVGVVSYGDGVCSSRTRPDVFAEVAADRGWLQAEIAELTAPRSPTLEHG